MDTRSSTELRNCTTMLKLDRLRVLFDCGGRFYHVTCLDCISNSACRERTVMQLPYLILNKLNITQSLDVASYLEKVAPLNGNSGAKPTQDKALAPSFSLTILLSAPQ